MHPEPRTPRDFLTGALVAGAIGAAASRAHALDRSGALAATLVGGATYGALGLRGTAVLLTFFTTSVALSRVGRARKRELVDVGKSGARDGWQVAANGGIAAACALASLAAPCDGATRRRLRAAFAGAFAAATADTWATEVGTLARGTPRSILTLRPVPTGLSGGVTVAGTAAEIAGAALLAFTASLLDVAPSRAIAIAAAGVTGALVDSLLGASVQTLRWCPVCRRACETDPHVCGTPTERVRGATVVGNDAVNFAATTTGALVGFALG